MVPHGLISPSEWPTWHQSEVLHIQTEADKELEVVQDTSTTRSSTIGLHKLLDFTAGTC